MTDAVSGGTLSPTHSLMFIIYTCLLTAESRVASTTADNEQVKSVKTPAESKQAEPVTATAVSGVNRRTMILFSKKAKQRRLSAIQLMAAKDFEKKETVKVDSTRTDVSELSRRSNANGFTVKLPLQPETSATEINAKATVSNAKATVAKRPPAKRQHAASSERRTESVICNGGVNAVVTGIASRSKHAISDDVWKKGSQHKVRVLDTALMLNGVSDSSDPGDVASSRYPIRGTVA